MKIGYIKIEKQKKSNNYIYDFFFKVIYLVHTLFNHVKRDKLYKNVFWINNFSKNSKEKLYRLLIRENIAYIVVENNIDIGYPKVESNLLLKYFLPEVVDYCMKKAKLENKEVYILVEKYNIINIDIIKELAKKVKVLNVVTQNNTYRDLENELENDEIYITVSSNKRKALKNAGLAINLDIENINDYTINCNMIIIDVKKEGINLPKYFNGIIIRSAIINTKKAIFTKEDLENFDKRKIIEAKILEMKNYELIRNWIIKNKIYIVNCKDRGIIGIKEFKRIKAEEIKIKKLSENIDKK